MRTRERRLADAQAVESLGSEEEAAPSTSSDEEVALRSGGKRGRKYYKPEDDEEEAEESSDGESEESEYEDEDGEQVAQQASKRRKRRPFDSGRSSLEIDPTNSEPYDEEEAALKRALSLSVREGTGASGSKEEGPMGNAMAGFDAEEAALQAALAASLADAGQSQKPAKDEPVDMEPGPEPGPSSRAETRPEAANGKGKKTPGKGGKGGPKRASYPEPSVEMVRQAFQMLDPTGAGIVNRIALKEVAQNLLHNELSEDQVDAMLEYADQVTRPEGASADAGLIDSDLFQQLVARFASPSARS